MMNKLAADLVLAGEDRHLQRVQGQAGPQVISDLPAHGHAGKQVSDESGIRKAAGRLHIRDIRDPPAVGRGGGEVPFQQVSWPGARSTGHRGPRLLALGGRPGDPQLAHQPLHRAPRHPAALAPQLQPYLPRPLHPAALRPVFPHPHDLLFQPLIPLFSRRRLALVPLRRVIRGDREFQDRAGRFDPEPVTVRIDEPD